jgi:acyl-[acyl-carrier-protein]-phospholipid O-acyltransferase/long-chain-fatty-acid--[acyl-carrier-protein] ligase
VIKQFGLLADRRFWPLFCTQALGALNDNIFKNALVILILYRFADQVGLDGQVLVTLAAGIFILPFFLFSATAGRLADSRDKVALVRRLKLLEVLLMSCTALAFVLGSVHLLLLLLFLMGAQSAFFGPIKYGILPECLRPEELIGGNALIQGATFLMILVGTLIGGLLVALPGGPSAVALLLLLVAGLGYGSSRWMLPGTAPVAADALPGWNFPAATWRLLRDAARQPRLFRHILAVSWFWFVGATLLSQIPALAKQTLSGNEQLVTFMLLLFSVGIGIGSLLCNRLLRGEVKLTTVPWGALGMTLFIADLYLACQGQWWQSGETLDVAGLLAAFGGWRISFDLLAIAVCGGLYIVPLNTRIQVLGDASRRASNIAANNVMNACLMVLSALAVAALLAAGQSVPMVLLELGALNLLAVALANRLFLG